MDLIEKNIYIIVSINLSIIMTGCSLPQILINHFSICRKLEVKIYFEKLRRKY